MDTQSTRQETGHLAPGTSRAGNTLSPQALDVQCAPLESEVIPAEIETSHPKVVHVSPGTSHTALHRSCLSGDYEAHKRLCARGIEPVAQQAAAGMGLFRFVRHTTTSSSVPAGSASGLQSLFHSGPPPEDLNYSLRNFVVVDPVQDPNVLYARIAIRKWRTMACYEPALPQPRRIVKNEEAGEGLGLLGEQ